MAKLVGLRERVHQPFRAALVRTSGWFHGSLQDRTELFTVAGEDAGRTNLATGSQLPSDQSIVILALRVFLWFRSSQPRLYDIGTFGGPPPDVKQNGDFGLPPHIVPFPPPPPPPPPGMASDVHRLYWQASEQLLWSVGAGMKYSITSMPSAYFPYGGGLHGAIGQGAGQNTGFRPGPPRPGPGPRPILFTSTGLILWNNGMPTHRSILRIARAILVPPRQNILCTADIVSLPAGPNASLFGLSVDGRNMLSLTDNLNAVDGINKVITITIESLFSRDVQ